MDLTQNSSDNRSSGSQQRGGSTQSKNYQSGQPGRGEGQKNPYSGSQSPQLSGADSIEDILQTVKGYAESATAFVKKRPVTILLGAVAIGAAVALIGTSMKSSKKWTDEHEK